MLSVFLGKELTRSNRNAAVSLKTIRLISDAMSLVFFDGTFALRLPLSTTCLFADGTFRMQNIHLFLSLSWSDLGYPSRISIGCPYNKLCV